MGIFDFALLKEEEKEKKVIPGWAQRMRGIGKIEESSGTRTLEVGDEAGSKATGKFDFALKPVLLTDIEQQEKELKDFETTYESLNASIATDYNQFIDLQKQLEEIGLDLQEAPEELTWFLQKKFEEVRGTHNSLVDKLQKDTVEQKGIYDSYTTARTKYEGDVDTYNRSANAAKKKTEPFVPSDYSPEKVAEQLKEGTYVGGKKPETLRNILGAYATFGKGLSMLPKALQVTFAQAVGGGQAAGINDTEEIDTLLKNTKDLDEFVKEAYMRYGSEGIFGIKITDLAELPQNLSYSVISSGAGAAVGIPIALVPFPGMRALAWASGTAVSGLACYRATEFQITQSYLEFKNEESIRETGKPLTVAEEKLLKTMFADDAKKYALWEAVPEALSNLNFWGVLAAPLTKTVGKSATGAILNKLSRIYLGEFSTEMITQMGQSSIEARAGMRQRGPMDWTNPQDYMEALREIAPQTFLLTTVMAGAGATVIETGKAFGKISKSLKAEIGENHPLLSVMEAKLTGMLTEQRGSFSWKDLTKKEVDLLAEEAKKYKSVEEFVESQFATEVFYPLLYGKRVEVIKNPTKADYESLDKEMRKDLELGKPKEGVDWFRELYDDRGNVYLFRSDKATHEDVDVWLEKNKGIVTGEGQFEGAKEKEVKRLTALYNKVAITPTNIEKAKEDLIKHGVREEFLTPEFMKKYMESPAIQELEKADVTGLSEEEALEEAKELEEIELSAEELVAAAKDVEPTADELDKIKKVQVAKEKYLAAMKKMQEGKKAAESNEVFYLSVEFAGKVKSKNIEVIKNPTKTQIKQLMKEQKSPDIRFSQTPDGDIYAFKGMEATHTQIRKALSEKLGVSEKSMQNGMLNEQGEPQIIRESEDYVEGEEYTEDFFAFDAKQQEEAESIRKKGVVKSKPVSLKTQVRNDKRKIKRLRDSIKRAKDTKEDVKTIKQSLHDYAKDMPLSIRGKMLTAIKTAANLKGLNEAMVKADEYTEIYYRKQYIKAIEKELTAKKVAPKKVGGILKGKFTPEVQRVLDTIKANINSSRTEALAQIEQNIKNFEAGETTDIAGVNELLNMQGIKEMTLNNLESTLDNIKALKDKGKTLKAEKETARKEALREKVIKAVETVTGGKLEIDEETGKPKIDTAYKTLLKVKWSEKGLLNKAKKAIDKIMNWQFGWDNLLDKLSALDKTSKPYESELSKIGFVIQYARVNQIAGVEEVIAKLQEVFSTAYKVEGRKAILNKVGEHKEDIDLGTFKNAEGHKIELILNKEQIMKKYMQLEDPTLESTFTKGMLYTDEIKDAIRGAITKEDVAYINGLREIYDTIYEKVNPIYGELYGVDLPRNPHYSGRILREGKEDTNIPENLLQVENAIHYASVLNPSLKQRSRTLSPLKYNEATPDILRYVLQMEHFVAFAKPLQELRGVFGNSTVKAVIKQGFGSDIYRKVTDHLQDITRDGVDKSNVIAWVDKIRGNLVRSILAKPIIGVKQVPSILAYMTEMPTADFFKGIANFWQNPIKNYRTLMDLSPYAKERFGKGFERDIHAAMREGYGNTLARTHKFSDIFFTHIRMGDRLAVVQGMWAKMYSETEGKGSTASKAKMVEGFRSAERSTERTQPTYTVESLAAGQRGGSFLKLLTMFQNQLNKYYRIIADNARNFRYGRGSRIKAASNITLAWVVLPLLFQLIGSAGKIRDKDLYRILLLGPLNDILVFAQMAKSIYGWLAGDTYDYQVSPAVSTMRELQKALQKVVKWKDPTKDMTTEDFVKMVEAASKAVGQLVGMPTPYGVQLTEAARAKDWRQILFSEYALREEEEPKKVGPVDMDKIYKEMGIKGFKKSIGKIPTKGIDMNKVYEKMGIK